MTIDVIRQNRCFALHLDGVTAAYEEQCEGRGCLLLTLTNTQPTPATAVVPLEGGQAVQFALLPFQKLEVYPPLVVAGEVQDASGTFVVE
jgi:hypothetical protein